MGKTNKIEKRLLKWENDLNPIYQNKINEFFGRLIRKLESGIYKVGYWLFVTHKWETKQERYLNRLTKQVKEIDRLLLDVKSKSPKAKALKRQLKTINNLCDLLLQRKNKVKKEDVYSLKETLQKHIDDKMRGNLIDAIGKQDIAKVEQLMEEDIVNQSDSHKYLPLHTAAHQGNIEIVRRLLPQVKDINCRTTFGTTPLHNAASAGHIEIVRMLIEHGGDQNARDGHGKLPFHDAAHSGHIEILELLMPDNIDIKDNRGRTALFHAASNNNTRTVEYLLQRGADPNIRDNEGLLPLHFAAWLDEEPVMDVLLPLLKQPDDVNVQDNKGRTLLSWAASYKKNSVEYLLGKNAQKNIPDHEGKLPFHHAAFHGKRGMMELLVPDNINIQDNQGKTALHMSAHRVGENVTRWLLAHQADVNIPDAKGRLPIHYAAKNGPSLIEDLKPENINIQDNNGRTPLSIAARRSWDALHKLLELGADPHIVDNKGNLPIHYAARFKDSLQLLADRYENINVKGMDDRTPLSFAAEGWNPKAIEFLLHRGATINIPDKNGNLPLHYAVKKGGISTIKILLKHSSLEDLKIRNKDGKTALMLAKEADRNELIYYFEKKIGKHK